MTCAMPLIQSLKALADEKRLNLICLVLNCHLCVGALARHLGLSNRPVPGTSGYCGKLDGLKGKSAVAEPIT